MNITAGIYKGRKIEAPDEKITRPTLSKVRMGVFNTLYSIVGDFEGKTFLDVFGGSLSIPFSFCAACSSACAAS